MKRMIIMAHCMRILANGMRSIENTLYYKVNEILNRMARAGDAEYAKANHLREHAAFVGGQYRDDKINAAIAEVNKEVDHRVAEVHLRADNHVEIGDKLYNILEDCK